MHRITSTTARKVLFIIYGTLLTACVVAVVWLHHGRRSALQKDTLARLGGLTGTLAAQLDLSRVDRLLHTYDSRGMLVRNTQDPWYYVMHESFRKAAEANELAVPVQLVVYDRSKQELQVVATSAERPMLRERYDGAAAGSCALFLQSAAPPTERLHTGSSLATIDRVGAVQDGSQAAVIIELPASQLDGRAQAGLWGNIGSAAALLLAVGFFLLRSVGRLVQREQSARDLLEQRHAGITDSIAYAGKIQGALVPDAQVYRSHFRDHFLLNRPKDVVSGDFHWYHRVDDDTCFVATADCTGHGLPGAMMAAIGCSLLNELATRDPGADPADLLARLNERMIATLHQDNAHKGRGDGMDIALCRVDRSLCEIRFAGALRPLYHVHQGRLSIIPGDRMPVGGNQHVTERRFTAHRMPYHPGDRIYLFSDGIVDQFGPQRKRFSTARFNAFIEEHQHLPMEHQAVMLERVLHEWRGQQEQLDDICVLGLAV